MYPWDLLHSIFGRQFDHCNFAAPYSQLTPVSYIVSSMQSHDPQSCRSVWKDIFDVTEKTLLDDDLPEEVAYQYEGQHYMYRGTIPEFSILATNNVQLTSVEQLEQFLEQELSCFSHFFERLVKFDLKLNQLPTVDVEKGLQYRYLYKFQLRPEKRYYDLYLELALQHTSLDKLQREAFAKNWAQQRHSALSAYIGYYQYLKTTYSFEGALYAVEQMLRHNWTVDMLPELMQRFQQKVDIAKNLVWDSEHDSYIEKVIRDYIHRNYFDSSLLHGKAQDVVLADLSRCAWRKVRSYQGKGNGQFRSFVKVVIRNKISDMRIEIQGKHRPPMWVVYKQKEDPIYKAAYEILLRKQHLKQEALSILMLHYPEKEKQFIRDVIDDVLKNCPTHTTFAEVRFEGDDKYQDDVDIESELEQLHKEEVLEQLKRHILAPHIDELSPYLEQIKSLTTEEKSKLREKYLTGSDLQQINDVLEEAELDEELEELKNAISSLGGELDGKTFFAYLEQCSNLTTEDRLILKLKFFSGLTQQAIADALQTSVSTVNRRLKRIFEMLKDCLERYFGTNE
ncbi:MAG: sigma-70 family RNA polymerase sigma factor [Thiotrichaceae bacterium]|nr:sigma-70 family RNA polymerase sigma factor [Thiotrichaceae bacterium]